MEQIIAVAMLAAQLLAGRPANVVREGEPQPAIEPARPPAPMDEEERKVLVATWTKQCNDLEIERGADLASKESRERRDHCMVEGWNTMMRDELADAAKAKTKAKIEAESPVRRERPRAPAARPWTPPGPPSAGKRSGSLGCSSVGSARGFSGVLRGRTDFEDQGSHRAPCASSLRGGRG